jgi:hypothetical protein
MALVSLEGGPKTTHRLPVTTHTPDVHMAAAHRFELLDTTGQRVRWIPEHEAHDLVAEGWARYLGTKQRARKVKLLGRRDKPQALRPIANTKYTHKRETEDNVHGVYAFRHLPHNSQELFKAVIDSCLKAA